MGVKKSAMVVVIGIVLIALCVINELTVFKLYGIKSLAAVINAGGIIIALGLMLFRNWARILTILFAILTLASEASYIYKIKRFDLFHIAFAVFFLCVILYFINPKTKEPFK